jgi:hypothetical protein
MPMATIQKISPCLWSWQIVPAILPDLVADTDQAKSGRVMGAVLKMKKLDIAQLKKAAAG